MPHVFTGDYLFSSPTDMPSAAFAAVPIIFGLLFVISALAFWRRAKLAPQNPVLRRFIRRVAKVGMWSAAVGLFLALMRYVEFPWLSAPILLDLLVLYLIVAAGYFVYDFSERYPLAVHKLEESHIERRYRPAARPRTQPQAPRPKVRGKRRR